MDDGNVRNSKYNYYTTFTYCTRMIVASRKMRPETPFSKHRTIVPTRDTLIHDRSKLESSPIIRLPQKCRKSPLDTTRIHIYTYILVYIFDIIVGTHLLDPSSTDLVLGCLPDQLVKLLRLYHTIATNIRQYNGC